MRSYSTSCRVRGGGPSRPVIVGPTTGRKRVVNSNQGRECIRRGLIALVAAASLVLLVGAMAGAQSKTPDATIALSKGRVAAGGRVQLGQRSRTPPPAPHHRHVVASVDPRGARTKVFT